MSQDRDGAQSHDDAKTQANSTTSNAGSAGSAGSAGELVTTESGTDLVIVLSTFPKPEDIGDIAITLVGENLCACVNILREVLSIHRWNGEIVNNKEVLCLFKTTRARHAALVARLAELHPYDVPEIVTLGSEAVNEPYLRWVRDETAG